VENANFDFTVKLAGGFATATATATAAGDQSDADGGSGQSSKQPPREIPNHWCFVQVMVCRNADGSSELTEITHGAMYPMVRNAWQGSECVDLQVGPAA
jgi:hypothetical protein